MKLNPDCIRDILIEVEKSWSITKTDSDDLIMDFIELDQLCQALPEYSKEDIFYSLYNLDQAGYLKVDMSWASGRILFDCCVSFMTYSGHEFLQKIRDPKHWSAIKSGISALRTYSLDAINALASGITAAAIQAWIEDGHWR